MAKIIFTSRYLKNKPTTVKNFVNYIATRENAEHFVYKNDKEATDNQKAWIENQLQQDDRLKDLFEYEDYRANSTMANASQLISRIAENNLESGDVKNYIGYLAHRPRSEKLEQGHALFSGQDKNIDLNKVKKEVSKHKGYIWTHVISLRRNDAERLGFDNAISWRELVRSKIPEIAKSMKIPIENLKWYGAFHNEGHHPHIHLMVYSSNPREGFLTEKCIEDLRRTFAKEIFHDEMYHAYEEKDVAKKEIQKYFMTEMEKARLLENESNPKAEILLLQLAKNMRTSKYKVYGRLTKANKNLVDEIVVEICKDKKIQGLYENWLGAKDAITSIYKNTSIYKPLDQLSEFRDIKNMVVRCALDMDIDMKATYVETDKEINFDGADEKENNEESENTIDIVDEAEIEVEQINERESHQELWQKQMAKRSFMSLMKRISKIIEDDYIRSQERSIRTESKLLRKIRDKKLAQGHKLE